MFQRTVSDRRCRLASQRSSAESWRVHPIPWLSKTIDLGQPGALVPHRQCRPASGKPALIRAELALHQKVVAGQL
jgi:hypothetical protein